MEIHGGAHLGVHSFADWPLAGSIVRSEGALDPTRIQSDACLEAFAELRGFWDPRQSKSEKSENSVKIRKVHENQFLRIY